MQLSLCVRKHISRLVCENCIGAQEISNVICYYALVNFCPTQMILWTIHEQCSRRSELTNIRQLVLYKDL